MFGAKESFLSDLAYSAWANQLLLDGCTALTAEEMERDLGVSHPHILATLRHVCDGEKIWLECLSMTPDAGTWRLPMGKAPVLSLDELRQEWPPVWDGYKHWLKGFPEQGLQAEIKVSMEDSMAPRLERWKILRHVLDHSTFHRGQMVGMIRNLGKVPPAINRMDYWLVTSDKSAS